VCCWQDGVVLGADTRSTNGDTVADKNCEKIHYIAPNVYCCGAGTAADTEAVTGMVSSQMELHRLATGRDSRVVTALTLLKSHLFKYQGNVSAALVLGGYDCTGPHLFTVRHRPPLSRLFAPRRRRSRSPPHNSPLTQRKPPARSLWPTIGASRPSAQARASSLPSFETNSACQLWPTPENRRHTPERQP